MDASFDTHFPVATFERKSKKGVLEEVIAAKVELKKIIPKKNTNFVSSLLMFKQLQLSPFNKN